MATQLKLRRGNTLQHLVFTGASGEVTFDTEANTLYVHDGITEGGHAIALSNSVSDLVYETSQQAQIAGNYANSAYIQANVSTINSLTAGEYANAAYDNSNTANDNANTRVLKSGDVMTGHLSTSQNIWGAVVYANTQFYAGVATYAATLLPNTVAQFTGNSSVYTQTNHQNINPDGSADSVVTSDVGDDETFYITTGIQNSNLEQGTLYPLDGYVLVQGNTGQIGGNLIIGSISGQPGQETRIVVGGHEEDNVIVRFTSNGANIKGNLIVNDVDILRNLVVSGDFDSALTTRISLHSNAAYNHANTKFASSGGTISGDVIVSGNLTVSGETVYANTTTVNLGDSILTLNSDIPQEQSPSENAGIEIDRGSSTNVQFIWNETTDKWTFTNDGTNYSDVGSASSELYANSAYSQANTATTNAATADQKAVSAGSYANSAYIHANNAFAHSNLTLGYSESSYSQANTATTNAATADQKAVSAGSYANSAYDQANTATNSSSLVQIKTDECFNKTNASFIHANSSYEFANTINVTFWSSFSNVNSKLTAAFDVANTSYTTGSYANSAYETANSAYSQANTATTNAATADQKAVSAGSYANSAFGHSNLTLQYATSGYTHTNAAYDHANTKFASTGGFITGFANVSSNVSVGTYIDINSEVTKPSYQEGRFFYDNEQHALAYYNEDSNMTVQIGQESIIRVWNNSAVDIVETRAVYINGSSSANGFPSVALARSDKYETSEVIGISTTVIPAYGYGYITGFGKINGIDTTLFSEGEEIYLSDTLAGQWSAISPSSPAIPVRLGVISKSDLTTGSLLVDITIRDASNKTNGSILFAYNNSVYEDAQHLFWDTANSCLGIGTNVPQANLHVVGSGLFTGNVVISGNLSISNAQSITTTELTVGGNTIVLNSEHTGTPTSNATIIVNRGSESNVYITWDETINEWIMYEGSGISGHILHSEKTAKTWADYTDMLDYEKSTHPIGSNLANSINEHAKAGYITANTSLAHVVPAYIHANASYIAQNTTGSYANSAYATANSAYQSANSASSYANSAYAQANTSLKNNSSTSTSGVLYASGLVSNTTITLNTSAISTSTGITTGSISQVIADSFSTTSYRTAKYLAQITSGSSYHVIELLLLHDGTSVYLTQYAETMSGTSLGTFDATIATNTLSLLFTPTNAVTTVKLYKTLIAV